MTSRDFQKIFGLIMAEAGFKRVGKGYYWPHNSARSCECVVRLEKSRWGDSFQCMLKIYVNGMFGKVRTHAEMVRDVGHVFRGLSPDAKPLFNLEEPIPDDVRTEGLRQYILGFLVTVAKSAEDAKSLLELERQNVFVLLPPVREELCKLLK